MAMRIPGTMDKSIEWLAAIEPERRRKTAFLMLIVSFALGHANIAAYVLGFVPDTVMNAITNYLSWLALTITAFDVLISTDVRVQQESESKEGD